MIKEIYQRYIIHENSNIFVYLVMEGQKHTQRVLTPLFVPLHPLLYIVNNNRIHIHCKRQPYFSYIRIKFFYTLLAETTSFFK